MHALLLGLTLLAQPFTTPHGSSATTSSFTFKDDAEAYFGTDLDYWWVYNSASTQYELQSSNVDGAGTDGIVCYVDDGTNDVVWNGGALYTAAVGAACIGDRLNVDNNGIQDCLWVTDSAPDILRAYAHEASPVATGASQTGANAVIAAGPGTRRAAATAASFVNNTTTITLTLDGMANVGTEGTAFECDSVTNAVCATNIASWANGLTGIDSCAGTGCTAFTGVAGTFYIYRAVDEPAVGHIAPIATSTGAALTIVTGTDGKFVIGGRDIVSTDGSVAGTWALRGLGFAGIIELVTASGGTNNGSFYAKDFYAAASSTAGVVGMNTTNGLFYGTSTFIITAGTMTGNTTGYVRPMWTKFAWTNAMIAACGAGTTCDIAVGTLPAKTLVKRAFIVVSTAATGPATLTMSVGRTAADYVDFVLAGSIEAVANTVYGDIQGEVGASLLGTAGVGLFDALPSYTATTLVNAHLISTVADVNTTLSSTGLVFLETELLP